MDPVVLAITAGVLGVCVLGVLFELAAHWVLDLLTGREVGEVSEQ